MLLLYLLLNSLEIVYLDSTYWAVLMDQLNMSLAISYCGALSRFMTWKKKESVLQQKKIENIWHQNFWSFLIIKYAFNLSISNKLIWIGKQLAQQQFYSFIESYRISVQRWFSPECTTQNIIEIFLCRNAKYKQWKIDNNIIIGVIISQNSSDFISFLFQNRKLNITTNKIYFSSNDVNDRLLCLLTEFVMMNWILFSIFRAHHTKGI